MAKIRVGVTSAPKLGETNGPDRGFSRHSIQNSHYKYVERLKIIFK